MPELTFVQVLWHRIAKSIELLRAENPKDQIAAEALIDRLSSTEPSQSDDETPTTGPQYQPPSLPTCRPLSELPAKNAVEVFGFEDIEAIAAFLRKRYTRAPPHHRHSGRWRIKANGTNRKH